MGNHESVLCNDDWNAIKETGVKILDNEWYAWNNIWIGGLTSHYVLERRATTPLNRYPERGTPKREDPIKEPDTSWLSQLPEGYKLVLSHHPEYCPSLPTSINLILSAHAHGGQWRFFGRGLFAPNQGWLPKYTKGVYDGRLIVSAGLTNTASIPRLNNPTEIVYINRK